MKAPGVSAGRQASAALDASPLRFGGRQPTACLPSASYIRESPLLASEGVDRPFARTRCLPLRAALHTPEDSWHYHLLSQDLQRGEAGIRQRYSLEATVWDHTAALDARILYQVRRQSAALSVSAGRRGGVLTKRRARDPSPLAGFALCRGARRATKGILDRLALAPRAAQN